MTDESLQNILNHLVTLSGFITFPKNTTFFVIYVLTDVAWLDYKDKSFDDGFEEFDEGVCGRDQT